MTPLVIFGARSYTAGELLRLLVHHPSIKPALVVSRSAAGESLDTLQPHLSGRFRDVVSADENAALAYLRKHADAAVALCTGSGESAPIVAQLGEAGLLGKRALVDLSGDFRLTSTTEYERWYRKPHAAPAWLNKLDYCIPELHRAQCKSLLVSNPGCLATAAQLACAPALRTKLVEPHLSVFAVTGSSGSGATAKANTHHPERAHDFYAYRPLTHQHTPEIRRGLALADDAELTFIAHSAPLVRGINVTATFRLRSGASAEQFVAAYERFAAGEPMLQFVRGPVTLAGIIGTNVARLGAVVEGTQAVTFCAIDNLCRGAAGQGLQNLNRVLGLAETTGLELVPMFPL